mmetsp:Transcript_12414/g.19235  ORF Transcript_12414/g.19235 Transcript_12414/m.19235 type:complete len:410 (-) Transcript_12414:206-1435(-)
MLFHCAPTPLIYIAEITMPRMVQSIAVGCFLFVISLTTLVASECSGVCYAGLELDGDYLDKPIPENLKKLLDDADVIGDISDYSELDDYVGLTQELCETVRSKYGFEPVCRRPCSICEGEGEGDGECEGEGEGKLDAKKPVEGHTNCKEIDLTAKTVNASSYMDFTKMHTQKCCKGSTMKRLGDGDASCKGICHDGTPLPDPEEMVTFLGTAYTCQDLEDMAKANETVCQDIASQKSIANDCACPDNSGCSVCPNNGSLPDPGLSILGIDGYTCGDVAAIDFISDDICNSFEKSFSYICGCPDAEVPECSACPEGEIITNLSGDLSELGLPVTCEVADDYAKMRCSDDPDENKRVQKVFRTVCGCAVPEREPKNELETWAKAVISVVGSIAFLAAMACLFLEYRKPIIA